VVVLDGGLDDRLWLSHGEIKRQCLSPWPPKPDRPDIRYDRPTSAHLILDCLTLLVVQYRASQFNNSPVSSLTSMTAHSFIDLQISFEADPGHHLVAPLRKIQFGSSLAEISRLL
jgi:hypothetical protein